MWTSNPFTINNQYFINLLKEEWELVTLSTGKQQYKAVGKDLYMLQTDLVIRWDPEMLTAAQDFASDNQLFLAEFRAAWTRLMNADRFDGPFKNLCAAQTAQDDLPTSRSS
uniref:Plant heme peroxidase family profile domain-containing protein n=1 Tax=Lotharella globosa TaxID=91324 RepID=A0A7S3ZIM4_9EUKA